ncbi:cytochrome c/c1 heme-lyase [Geopyxis carbonaria]|nr:cytochrome c/c1 heme-lyase [Geopyxis carbonaria]
MGWFWADAPSTAAAATAKPANHPTTGAPPPSCPMHKPDAAAAPPPSCPMHKPDAAAPPSSSPSSSPASASADTDQTLNPLNFMFANLPQTRAPGQKISLPTEREASSIPKSDGAVWEYPSPQQMYNAMRRKGYADAPEDAVESMVAIHNWLNEGAWAEISAWESKYRGGVLGHLGLLKPATPPLEAASADEAPRLLRFQGRRADVSPKARMYGALGRVFPTRFGGPAPFDRHDWYVLRKPPGEAEPREVRYVIDYYAGPPEPTGEPVFYLDVRPAIDRPGLMMERIVEWVGPVWEKASGLDVRRAQQAEEARKAAGY